MKKAVRVWPFRHEETGTWSYVVAEPDGPAAVVVDPVLDFDSASGCTDTGSLAEIVERIEAEDLTVERIIETHAHADHLSGAPWLKRRLGAPIAIGEGIRTVQAHFRPVFNVPEVSGDGSEFDELYADGDTFSVGAVRGRVIHTPGHTADSMTWVVGDAAFVGDTLFMPDGGTARCDFPGGDARTLFRSIGRIFELPPETRIFVCHDYRPGGREPRCETTVAEQRRANIHVGGDADEAGFVRRREARDRTLDMPRLIIPSIQVNIRAGRFPDPEDNGIIYLKIPVDAFE